MFLFFFSEILPLSFCLSFRLGHLASGKRHICA